MQRNNELSFPDKNFPLLIHRASISQIRSAGEGREAIHEAIEIKYFYEGTSTLMIGNKTVGVAAGDVVVINPYEFHSTVDYGKEKKGRYHCIMVGLDFFDGVRGIDVNLRHLIFGHKKIFRTKISDNRKLADIITRLAEESECEGKSSRLMLFGICAELFAELIRVGIDEDGKSPTEDMIKSYATIEPAIRMIRDNFQAQFTVEELASACNVSKFHFSRIFKSVMTMSPMQYLISYRLTVADSLLSETEMRISEIAEAVGFLDVGYFSRTYKRHFGRSPGRSRLTDA